MVAIEAKELKTFDEKNRGLLGAKKPKTVFFETRWGIHTFFMKFSIDVVILDDHMRVVSLRKSLKPYRIFVWMPIHKKVVELKEGSIEELGIKKGDTVSVSFVL